MRFVYLFVACFAVGAVGQFEIDLSVFEKALIPGHERYTIQVDGKPRRAIDSVARLEGSKQNE